MSVTPSRMPPTRSKVNGDSAVGVQKLKSALRQTKRLLVKDNLDAEVRITTERRLAGLEEQLSKAETVQRERKYATRYHMVKFFDKKKVCRKIEQLKSRLEREEGNREGLEKELFEKRVELNYIMHYPSLKKYISLYPSDRGTGNEKEEKRVEGRSSKTDERREELMSQTREAMRNGKMSSDPELEVREPGRVGLDTDPVKDVNRSDIVKVKKKGRHRGPKQEVERALNVEEDDFFAAECMHT